ncbi:MAG: cbb3-type cytochrome c oxidase subunit I [Dehalococcoidia bacterium]
MAAPFPHSPTVTEPPISSADYRGGLLGDMPDQAARWFLYSGIVWLVAPVIVGLLLAIFLFQPAVQEHLPATLRPYVIFGRLRPVHVNLALFGWLSMTYAATMLYLTPRLVGAPLYSERLARATLALWNLLMLAGGASLLLGFNQGREYAELPWLIDIGYMVAVLMLAANVWGTVARRTEKRLYISVWNWMAATLIFPFIWAIGNKVWDTSGAYTGATDAIVNFFYVHNIFNVWFTTGGIGIFLYLIPRVSGNPLYSHRLAIWGFASVWAGQHHLLYGPGPEWLEILSVAFSITAAIPNTAFLVNYIKTMEGSWGTIGPSMASRCVLVAVAMYSFTCVQGIAQSFRNFSSYIHFTNWVVGHSHLAFVGSWSFLAFAVVYLLLPRMVNRPMYSRTLAEWHFWLTLSGLLTFMFSLWAAGIVQGSIWASNQVPFLVSVQQMHGFFFVRLLAGLVMVAGFFTLAWNVYRTARARPTDVRPEAGMAIVTA